MGCPFVVGLWGGLRLVRARKAAQGAFVEKFFHEIWKGEAKVLTRRAKIAIIALQMNMQASPSGMAAASQAASGEFDSRRLLQNKNVPRGRFFVAWRVLDGVRGL